MSTAARPSPPHLRSDPTAPPEAIRAAAARALRTGATHYTDRAGIPELRAAVARGLGGDALGGDRVVITGGVPEGMFLALRARLAAGDAVATVGRSPFGADAHRALLKGLGLRAASAGDRDGNGNGERVGDGDRADAVIVFADETFGDDGRRWPAATLTIVVETLAAGASSLAATGLVDEAVIIGDFAFAGLSGWAIGYLVGPVPLLEPLIELKQGLNICTAAVSQHAGAAASRLLGAPADLAPSARTPAPAPTRPQTRALAPTPTRPLNPTTKGPSRMAATRLSDDGTRQRYELLDLLARTPGAISLGRGDPDLATPAPIVEAAIAAFRDPVDDDPLGRADLRRAIAAKLAIDNGITADPSTEILVTTGGQEAIFLALQALLEPGDEILMPSPRYTAYDVAVNVAGARIIDVAPPGRLDFDLDVAGIEAAITPRTRALLVISPGNPTAAVISRERVEAVAAVARRHQLTVISDEIYERIVYDDAVPTSFAALPGASVRTITVGGFSKAYAMTGWRVGYLVADAELIARAARLKMAWTGLTSHVAQMGALAALRGGPELVADALTTYARRRTLTLDALRSFGIEHAPAQGAFYVFFDIAPLGLPSFALSRQLLQEAGVFLYPGSGFGAPWSGHMRLAWLQPEPRLHEALTRMGDWIAAHR